MRRRTAHETESRLLQRAAEQLTAVLGEVPPRWLLVTVAHQQLWLVEGGRVARRYGVSTAAVGLDAREGSFGTPPGVHRIERRIGGEAPLGTWFRSREPVGRTWPADDSDDDLVLTRILTLEGLEPGVNRGPGIDSRERFIYIHGTNREAAIGRPVSRGCIRMSNTDVIHLFDQVREGDPVVIL